MRFLLIFLMLITNLVQAQNIKGAWKSIGENGKETIILATENYITVSTYNAKNIAFEETYGGKYELSNTDELILELQFHSKNAALIGATQTLNVNIKKKSLSFKDMDFENISDKKPNALSGLWRITQIMRDGNMQEMKLAPRRTLKIMAGGYFQWFAINTNTFEFFGTGGGKYTLENGKYTEEIQFFSRDASRVGAKLNFDASVSENNWTHSGNNSKGEPLKEIWSKF